MSKICKTCNVPKDLIDFNLSKKSNDGLQDKCKDCFKIYYNLNKSNIKSQTKKYYLNNKDKKKQYQLVNKDSIKVTHKNYERVNKKKIKLNQKIWHFNNKEYLNEYQRNRYIYNLNYKISVLLRSRFYKFIKDNKNNNVIILLGCTLNFLKQYLESQFKPEMTWSNHGIIWEIDHIIPCSKFDLTKEEEQQKCFHYTNLQPLFKTTEIAEQYGYNEIGNRNKSNN